MTEKPREKLKRLGVEGLKDEELLALILRTGYKGKNAMGIAKNLLDKYKTKSFIDITYSDLRKIKGIGEAKAAEIVAAIEFAKRCLKKPIGRIKSAEDIIPYVIELRDRKKENFVVLYLNAKNVVIWKEYISIGTLDTSVIHPRDVFAPAIEKKANSLIIVHNHPSGDATSSEDDKNLTKILVKAGEILGIEVLDHIIVTKESFFSFKEEGLI